MRDSGQLINNPRRACAARVTVLGGLSVRAKLTSRISNRAINECAPSVACERQNIGGDLPEATAFKRYAAKHERKSQYANYSGLPAVSFLRSMHSETPELSGDCQQHSALSKTMPTDAASSCWSEN